MSELGKAELRRLFRARRRALSALAEDAPDRAAQQFDASKLPPFAACAVYLPIGSEIDPTPLARTLARSGATVALPVVIARDAPLMFRRALDDAPLEVDALGLSAPGPTADPVTPDLIVTPLLAFDAFGGRLGQGGGFYDRTLASLRAKGQVFALGLAYDGQEIDRVACEDHDEPLDGVLTPSGLRLFGRGRLRGR